MDNLETRQDLIINRSGIDKYAYLDNYKVDEKFIEKCEECAVEGMILLKNDNDCLPMEKGTRVSVFGRTQLHYFYCGYGSGGDVSRPYVKELIPSLKANNVCINEDLLEEYIKFDKDNGLDMEKEYGWGEWPLSNIEYDIPSESIEKASKYSSYAIVVIGRSAGEDRDCKLEKGSYYLTDIEYSMLKRVSENFDRTILLINSGNLMDMSFLREIRIDAVLLSSMGGMVSGDAISKILTGSVSPSGKLTQSILNTYEDYPSSNSFSNMDFNNYQEDIFVGYRYSNTFRKETIMYPFGYGLSYTSFKIEPLMTHESNRNYTFELMVENTGKREGKCVVEIYLRLPGTTLSQPELILCGYSKTNTLMTKESEIVRINVSLEEFSSFDDNPSSPNRYSYILEKGRYDFFYGEDSINITSLYSFNYDKDYIVRKCVSICSLKEENEFERMERQGSKIVMNPVPLSKNSLRERILSSIKETSPLKEWDGRKLSKDADLDEFMDRLSMEDYFNLLHGYGEMQAPFAPKNSQGVLGGYSESLSEKGVPFVVTADGPSGVRCDYPATLMPIGTMMAQTWNNSLIEEIGRYFGKEAKDKSVDIILSPGMNIHRNPLCGRNFEYFSEDPFLSGMMAASIIKGIEDSGTSSCPKHFCLNNQEKNRCFNDSRVSERALREIYLRNFEIMLRHSKPSCIMTSYNMINGVYAHNNYDLATEFLRNEMGYEGLIITDWWMRYRKSPEFENVFGNAYRARAGVNVLMPGGTGWDYETSTFNNGRGNSLLENYGKEEAITLFELKKNAKYVLKFIQKHKFE